MLSFCKSQTGVKSKNKNKSRGQQGVASNVWTNPRTPREDVDHDGASLPYTPSTLNHLWFSKSTLVSLFIIYNLVPFPGYLPLSLDHLANTSYPAKSKPLFSSFNSILSLTTPPWVWFYLTCSTSHLNDLSAWISFMRPGALETRVCVWFILLSYYRAWHTGSAQ